jgi:hypothetical protein
MRESQHDDQRLPDTIKMSDDVGLSVSMVRPDIHIEVYMQFLQLIMLD